MPTKTITEILPTVGVPRDTVENWLIPERLQLSTQYAKPEPGLARQFDRRNTLELTLVGSFVKAGFPASSAVAVAAAVLRADKSKRSIKEFWSFPAGEPKGIQSDTLSLNAIEKAWPPVLTIVHVGEIVRRVDALFDQKD